MYKSYMLRIYLNSFSGKFFFYQAIWLLSFMSSTFSCLKKKATYVLSGEYLSINDCSRKLTQLKKEKTWLKEVDSCALTQSLRDFRNRI